MDMGALYFSLQGRISRKSWWLGVFGLIIIYIIVAIVMGVVGGVTGLASSVFGLGLLSLIAMAIVIFPSYALSIKRLHDRGRPEMLAIVFLVPSVMTPVLQMLGLTGEIGAIEIFGVEAEAYKANMLGQLMNVLTLGFGVWALIELGVMKGRSGENAHGPDPLA